MKKIISLLLFSLLFQQEARTQTVTDIDGNVYNTVVIGTQIWMQQNLKTTRYQNSDAIGEVEDSATWANIYNINTTTPAWCIYEDNMANDTTYSKLYNWYAVVDPRNVCPTGWHVPSDSEWEVLGNFLGGDTIAGGHMKSKTVWASSSPDPRGDNSSGFSGFPGGFRNTDGTFGNISYDGYWWSSSTAGIAFGNRYAFARSLDGPSNYVFRNAPDAQLGYSVRCLSNSSIANGVISPQNNETFSLYPNPNAGEFTFDISPLSGEGGSVRVDVLNLVGQTIWTQLTSITKGQLNDFIHLPDSITTGMYFLRVVVGQNVYTARVNIIR